MINNFKDFSTALLDAGFSLGGGNDKGIFALINFGWEAQDSIDSPVKWHTGDPETDPWEWRMRVLEERDDIAYSKVFFKTSGFITKEWYPLFYSVRRKRESLEEAYYNGKVSSTAKRIYDIISENGETAFHEIKSIGEFQKEENSKFESTIVWLQMHMYITMCGRAQKINKYGEGYGWNSTVFTRVEDFWEKRGVSITALNAEESYDKIKAQVLKLNPNVGSKKTDKFIRGE